MEPTQLNIQARDEEDSHLPRWGLALYGKGATHYASSCYLELEWSTRNDGKWGSRSAQHRTLLLDFNAEEIEALITAATKLPQRYPNEYLNDDQVHTHGGDSPTRANEDSVICRCVSFVADAKYEPGFYIRKTSPVWTESAWGKEIMVKVAPHLAKASWRSRSQPRILP